MIYEKKKTFDEKKDAATGKTLRCAGPASPSAAKDSEESKFA